MSVASVSSGALGVQPLFRRARAIAPGAALTLVIAAAALQLAPLLHLTPVLISLLLGATFSFLAGEARIAAGAEFSARDLLRAGVALLGAKVTAAEISALGAHAMVLTVAILVCTLGAGFLVARGLRLSIGFSILSAGAVAICGASAALAISAALPHDRGRAEETSVTVALVTVIGSIAMVVYPMAARLLGLDPHQTAIFLGASLHEMAQAAGAGYAVSPEVGAQAVAVKLIRIACLAPTVLLIGSALRGRADGGSRSRPAIIPWFMAGFVVLAVASSLNLLPSGLVVAGGAISQWCLLAAIAALGMRVLPARLATVGWRPAVAVSATSLLLAAGSVAALRIMGG